MLQWGQIVVYACMISFYAFAAVNHWLIGTLNLPAIRPDLFEDPEPSLKVALLRLWWQFAKVGDIRPLEMLRPMTIAQLNEAMGIRDGPALLLPLPPRRGPSEDTIVLNDSPSLAAVASSGSDSESASSEATAPVASPVSSPLVARRIVLPDVEAALADPRSLFEDVPAPLPGTSVAELLEEEALVYEHRRDFLAPGYKEVGYIADFEEEWPTFQREVRYWEKKRWRAQKKQQLIRWARSVVVRKAEDEVWWDL